MVSVEHTAFSV